jgi:2-polyprenyl-3-methyl-5-hydroxy-6-metoxy-1,4-benzoquinol methylase
VAHHGRYVLHSEPSSSHQQIARLVRRSGRQPVLDVGAAYGFLGQLLMPDHVVIDAVEPSASWAEGALPYYRTVYQCAIEAAPLPQLTYPLIVCADVLEHTVDPVAVLRHLQEAATADALFIVSLPNIAHIAARLLLLTGRFPAMERGIFDRTHLHFYTRQTARDLLATAGLHIIERSATPAPLAIAAPALASSRMLKPLMRLQSVGLRLTPTLFAYQWIMVARRAR